MESHGTYQTVSSWYRQRYELWIDKPITPHCMAVTGKPSQTEILLGIGGILTLKKLGITKEVYHSNEGHAALCNLQRLCDYVENGLTFNQAMELVRASGLYTVHTPVPAGHDYFRRTLFENIGCLPWKTRYILGWIYRNGENPDDHSERFCMSIFACNTCQEVNGVGKLHGWVSQQMFRPDLEAILSWREPHIKDMWPTVCISRHGLHGNGSKLYTDNFRLPHSLSDQSNQKNLGGYL